MSRRHLDAGVRWPRIKAAISSRKVACCRRGGTEAIFGNDKRSREHMLDGEAVRHATSLLRFLDHIFGSAGAALVNRRISSSSLGTAFHRLGFDLRHNLTRSSTVVCATLSTRAMARMLSPFSAKTRTCASNFSPNAVALMPKCSTASAFRNGARSRRGVRWANLKNRLLRASFRALTLRSSVQPELASDVADVSPRVQGRPNRFL